MSRSPAFHTVLFLIAGILLGHEVDIENRLFFSILPGALVLLGIASCQLSTSRSLKSLLSYLCLIFSGVMLCISDRPPVHSDDLIKTQTQQILTLRAIGFASGMETDLYFDAAILTRSSSNTKLRVFLPKLESSSRLKIEYGSELTCIGQVEKFSGSRNPGQADFARIFINKGLLFAMRAEACQVTSRSSWKIIRSAYELRTFIKNILWQSDLDASAKGISLALSIGDKSALPDATKESFKASGLMHLLAISGLHVGFIALGLFHLLSGVFRRLAIPHHLVIKTRVFLVLIILLLYIILTGLTDSVLRSSIMCSVYVLSLLSRRPFNSLNALSISAIIILFLRPHHLLDLGFQLSFSAVFGIIILYPKLKEKLDTLRLRVSRAGVQMVCLSGVAFIATSPILLFHFSYAPLIGILSSVVSTPLCFLALTSLWLWIGLSVLAIDASILEYSLGLFLSAFTNTASFFSKGLFIDLGIEIDHSEGWLIVILIFVSLLFYLHLAKRKNLKWINLLLVPSLILLLIVGFQTKKEYDIIFFDVGHGDSILIRSPEGRTILIDAGDKSDYAGFSRDMGQSVLLPAFKFLGVDSIDLAFLSHRHRDHFGGFESLVGKIPIETFLSNDDDKYVSDSWDEFKMQLTNSKIDLRKLSRGDQISMGGINIKTFNPKKDERLEGENNQSLQLLVRIGEIEILFLGDSELEAEWNFLDNQDELTDWSPDIIKVGHHGSKTSSSKELIQFLREENRIQTAIISASGSFRPPSNIIRSGWENEGFNTMCTCDNGAVWIKTDGKHFYTPS